MLRPEADRSVYDAMWADEPVYQLPLKDSPYYPLFKAVADEVRRRGVTSVLEVGCGGGSLAELLLEQGGVGYHGFDFSSVAVQQAGRRLGRPDLFYVADATDPASYQRPYEGIVCTEVLEHVEHDRSAVRTWASGAPCICSVPNFDYPTHVRFFRHEDEVAERYGDLIDIDRIVRVAKPIFAGITLREYLRKLRWARDQPKRLMGLLGINTFDNIAGWFLLSGTRK
jgi:2-polyprenyl-3-methyl-5-hydroxy-6-metoxy-1,4-benzoquinol methylase